MWKIWLTENHRCMKTFHLTLDEKEKEKEKLKIKLYIYILLDTCQVWIGAEPNY